MGPWSSLVSQSNWSVRYWLKRFCSKQSKVGGDRHGTLISGLHVHTHRDTHLQNKINCWGQIMLPKHTVNAKKKSQDPNSSTEKVRVYPSKWEEWLAKREGQKREKEFQHHQWPVHHQMLWSLVQMELEESRCLWRLCLNSPSGDMGEKGDCNGLASEWEGKNTGKKWHVHVPSLV